MTTLKFHRRDTHGDKKIPTGIPADFPTGITASGAAALLRDVVITCTHKRQAGR